MAVERFELTSELPVPPGEAWAWHARTGAFERLTPPWETARVLERSGSLGDGRVVLQVSTGPVTHRWVARHRDAIPERQFVDEQVEGPFARWVHTHLFEPAEGGHTRYTDRIEYQLPGGAAGAFAGAGLVRKRLQRTFRYRHATVAADLLLHRRLAAAPMTVAITGATGLLGGVLSAVLTTGGHSVRRVTRRPTRPDDIRWDPARGQLDAAMLAGVDAVVHLAGETIAGGRWTAEKRRRILESRTQGTTLLAETLARLPVRPKVLVAASAVGIYGHRGEEVLTEESGLRTGPEASFVEQVGHAWEACVEPAERAGIRTVRARIGIVETPAGGALAKMLPPFLAGAGGVLGPGTQWTSWIGIDDVVGALCHALVAPSVRGPLNLTAPAPVTNAEFTRVLARVLGRPAVVPVPAAALRLLLGDLADELLLASTRVVPLRLKETGYEFRHPELEGALRHVLGR